MSSIGQYAGSHILCLQVAGHLHLRPVANAFFFRGPSTVGIASEPSRNFLLAFRRLMLPAPIVSRRKVRRATGSTTSHVFKALAISSAEVIQATFVAMVMFAFVPALGRHRAVTHLDRRIVPNAVVFETLPNVVKQSATRCAADHQHQHASSGTFAPGSASFVTNRFVAVVLASGQFAIGPFATRQISLTQSSVPWRAVFRHHCACPQTNLACVYPHARSGYRITMECSPSACFSN